MLKPRRNELDAVIALMDTEGYESADDLAWDIVKTVAEELGKRQTYLVHPTGSPLVYGPYYYSNDAVKAWKEDIGPCVGGEARLIPAFHFDVEDDEGPTTCECGHGKPNHVVKVKQSKAGPPQECGVVVNSVKCPCSSYTREKKA